MNKLFQKRKEKVRVMKVNSTREAWEIANILFPTDYKKSHRGSEAAGYDIYASTAKYNESWISDLGNRLEVNVVSEKGEVNTTNIWIEGKETKALAVTVKSMTGEFKEYTIENIINAQYIARNLVLAYMVRGKVEVTTYNSNDVIVTIHQI